MDVFWVLTPSGKVVG